MNYIYDILLNFQPVLYDFYEWNINDDIQHIRKIPVFHITQKQLNEIRDHKIVMDADVLSKIHKKAELFTKKEVEMIGYACILSTDLEALAVKFDQSGSIIKKSKLLIDEENETLDVASQLSIVNLKFRILRREGRITNKTRREFAMERKLRREVQQLKSNNIEKLKYLYYECFDQKENDIKRIMNSFETVLKREWNPVIDRMSEFFKLTQSQK